MEYLFLFGPRDGQWCEVGAFDDGSPRQKAVRVAESAPFPIGASCGDIACIHVDYIAMQWRAKREAETWIFHEAGQSAGAVLHRLIFGYSRMATRRARRQRIIELEARVEELEEALRFERERGLYGCIR